MMRHLILIRHAHSQVDPHRSAHTWGLSSQGRQQGPALAAALAPYDPPQIFTSEEPKAVETALLAADQLGLPHHITPGLHEHARETAPFFPTPTEFQATVTHLFQEPEQLVFGEETAQQAHSRFSLAVEAVVSTQKSGNVAIVSHGTVITLYVTARNAIDPVPFWQGLGMPALVVLTFPRGRLVEVVNIPRSV